MDKRYQNVMMYVAEVKRRCAKADNEKIGGNPTGVGTNSLRPPWTLNPVGDGPSTWYLLLGGRNELVPTPVGFPMGSSTFIIVFATSPYVEEQEECLRGGRTMSTQPTLPRRRFPRLKDYDYSQPGTYFVTICVQDRSKMLGEVVDGSMYLSPAGEIVQAVWEKLPQCFAGIALDGYVVMPNHVHGIVVITDAAAPSTARCASILGEIIRTFKAVTTRSIRVSANPEFRWQPKYWDSIIRNERHLHEVQQYIANNPARWTLDQLYL